MDKLTVDCSTGEVACAELTAEELAQYDTDRAAAAVEAARIKPLDPPGVAATLNAVLGVWSLPDAANAVRLPEQALIDEATAWAALAGA